MKKLFALLAVVLAVVSCQKDVDNLNVNVDGKQETVVTVSLPEETRANSAESGWKNTKGTLRVIMQIFDENGNTTDTMRFDDEVLTYGNTTVNYNVRLVPGHKYTFVAWADQGTEGQYFNTSNLKNVTFVDGAWTAMNENIDAYTDTETVEAGNSIRSINLVLTRPFAKVRVVATDINAVLAQGWAPTAAVATYQETVPVSFNAFAGVVGETAPVVNPVRHVAYNDQYDDNAGEMTLFADYLYVPTSGTAKFEFAINGVDNNGNDIAIRNDIVFNTPIPAVRNKLTTIKGNILTDGSNIKVEVDEEFEQPGNEIEVVEIPVTNATELIAALANSNAEIILQNDIDMKETTLVINTPAETRAASTLPGRNITIDGNGKTLISSAARAINVSGINGVTIKNLKIDASGERAINIIQNATNVTIDNVTATAAKYTVNVATSAPNAVVAIKNSNLTGLNTVNVAAENADVTIDNTTITTVDNSPTEGYQSIALNKDAKNGKIVATNTTVIIKGSNTNGSYKATNGAEGGYVSLNGSTDEVNIDVAYISYGDNYYGFSTIAEAIDEAEAGETVGLIRNVELTEPLVIANDKSLTIDGNGKTISTSDNRIIRITESNAKVTISNVNFVSSAVMNYPSDVRGVSIDPSLSNVELTLNNCSIDFTDETTTDWTYAVNIAGNGTGHKVTVNGGTYEGANVINAWGANNTITVKNATLNSLYPDSTLYCGVCISTLNCQGTSVYAEGNTFNGKNAKASDLGTGNTLDAKNNVDNTTLFVANGLYKDTNKAYVVTNAAGLVALSGMTINGKEIVTLGADIDLNGVEFNGLNAFNPESNNTFDGKGFTVSNWTNNSGASDMGFIKNWVGPIKNVKFDNCHLKTSGRSAIVAAKVYGNIENVEVKNSSIEDSNWACGIIAGLYNNGNISNCTVMDSSVKSNGGTSAIVGVINETSGKRNLTNCSVTNCTINNTGAYGESYSGGALVGMFNVDNTTYSIEGCTVSNNALVGSHVFEKYPANENVIEK